MSTNDPEFYQAPKFTPEQYQPPPKQRGCFFYGCIIASVLAVLTIILIAVGLWLLYRFANRMVDEYTATAPLELPKVEMPDEERKSLHDRVEAFRKAVNEGTANEPLVLTSDDVNALIDDNAELKGKIYVRIEGDELKGRVSIPLEKLLPLTMLKGRYLNGEADLKASLFDGELIVHIDAIEVNGKKPPEQIMTDVRKENIAKDMKDPDTTAMLKKIQSLEIKDGKIILKARAKSGATDDAAASKKAGPLEVVPSGAGQPKSDAAKKAEPDPKKAEPEPKKAA